MTDYTQQVTEALDKLGATSADIAQTLENKGVRGVKTGGDTCAISVYLTEQFPELVISTSAYRVYLNGPCDQDLPLPLAAVQFVEHFDAGRYPNLVSA